MNVKINNYYIFTTIFGIISYICVKKIGDYVIQKQSKNQTKIYTLGHNGKLYESN